MDNQPLTQEESYVERRKLFKNIWETAMHIEEKDNRNDVLNKPKVIKTLRLSDVDRSAGKRKKQRIKNLRTVCKKILDFCDRQDADDMFYEQLMIESHGMPQRQQVQTTIEGQPSKQKTSKNIHRKKNRMNSTKMNLIIGNLPQSTNRSPDKLPLTTTKHMVTAGDTGSHRKIKRYKRKKYNVNLSPGT